MTTGTTFETIRKPPLDELPAKPNIDRESVSDFDWQSVYEELDWLPGGGLNKAHEAIDRHANGRDRDKLAMIWEGKTASAKTTPSAT